MGKKAKSWFQRLRSRGQLAGAHPPRWHFVEVLAPEGTQVALRHDGDGILSVVIRYQGQPWPDSAAPAPGRVFTIGPGQQCISFGSTGELDGAGHDFVPHAEDGRRCAVCDP